MLTKSQKDKINKRQIAAPRSIEDDYVKAQDKIVFLEKQVMEAERTIEILVVAGFVSATKVEEARALVQSLIWK